MPKLKASEYEYYVRFSEPGAPSSFFPLGTTLGRSTTAADTPASIHVPPSLGSPPTFQLSLFDGVDPVLNPRGSIGSVVLDDPKGVLDTYAFYVTDGGLLELRRGTPGAALSTFTTVASLTTAGLTFGHETKEFRLHNLTRILEAATLHDERFSGEGGAGGDASLAGVLKPYCVGRVRRVPAVLMNTATRIYMVSCTPIEAIDGVAEGGASLTFSGNDRADYAALAAATITPGYYDTCLAEGLFRTGASALYDITADVQGDKTGGVYVETRGDIAKRIVTRSGVGLTAGQIDGTALAALNSAKPETCGFYWGSEITKAQALIEVMQGILGYWYINLSGSLILGFLSAPGSSPDVVYEFGNQTGAPEMMESVRPPRWKTSISYQRNNLQGGRIAGIIPDALKVVFTQDAQWASEVTETTYNKYPSAIEKRTYSGLWDEADAQTEATAQQTLLSTPLGRWRIPIYEDPFVLAGYLGRRVGISNYPRYAWNNPHTYILASVEWGADLIPIATLWG